VKRMVALVLGVVLALASTGIAGATGNRQTSAGKRRIDHRISQAEKVMKQYATGVDDATLDAELAQLGWEKIQLESSISPMSSAGSGSVTPLGVYRQTSGSYLYLVSGKWAWNAGAVYDSYYTPDDYVGLGLVDGNSNALTNYPPVNLGINVYDKAGTLYSLAGNAIGASQSGARYQFTDNMSYPNSIGDHGTVWFFLNGKPNSATGTYWLNIEWHHTFGSTYGLQSVILSFPWSLTATFANNQPPKEWAAFQQQQVSSTAW